MSVSKDAGDDTAPEWAFMDCAHYGISPNRMVQSLNGGAPAPSYEEFGRSPEELREWIETMPDTFNVRHAYALEAERLYPDERDVSDLLNIGVELPAEAHTDIGAQMIAGPRSGVRYSPTYDIVAGVLAKRMLHWMMRHPRHAGLPVGMVARTKGTLDAKMMSSGVMFADLAPTGFQVGWAANAAKYILGLPRVANPALRTVRDTDELSATLQVIDEKLREDGPGPSSPGGSDLRESSISQPFGIESQRPRRPL